MAVYLAITDGTTTVDLSAAYMDYVPQAANYNEEWVSERGSFRFASGIAGWRTDIQNVGRLLTQASEYQKTHNGARVYVNFKWQTSDDLYRSELAGGLIIPDQDALRRSQANAATPSLGLFEIEWTRRNWWEDDTERTLPAHGFNVAGGSVQLYNSYNITDVAGTSLKVTSGGTAYTGTIASVPLEAWLYPPVVHYTLSGAKHGTFVPGTSATAGGTAVGSSISSGSINYVTGVWTLNFSGNPTGTITGDFRYGYGNYIDLAGTAVAGDLPAPLKLNLTLLGLETIVGVTYGSAATWKNAFEIETYSGTFSDLATVTASNGTYSALTLGTAYPGNHFQIFPASDMAGFDNNFYTPILNCIGTPDLAGSIYSNYNANWQIKLFGFGATYISDGIRFYADKYNDGTDRNSNLLRFPPISFTKQMQAAGESVSSYINFAGKIITLGGGSIVKGDFIQFMPTLGGYGEFLVPYSVGPGNLTIDGITERVYVTSGTLIYPDYIHKYGYPSVMPGQANRIYMLTGAAFLGSAQLVTNAVVSYRPRKRII